MNGIKPDPDIKMDPDAITPSGSGYMDDDFYEDTGELQLPPANVDKDMWLTRIPKWLYEKVGKWQDFSEEGRQDEEIVVGDVLIFVDPQTQRASKDRPVRMFLDDRWHAKADLPRAWELEIPKEKSDQLPSTYIFTEKDLPGYKPNGLGQSKGPGGSFAVQDPKAKVQKRSKYRKAIPKHTSLLGTATREYVANPIRTEEYIRLEKQRTREAIQGVNRATNIIEGTEYLSNDRAAQRFKSFIRPAIPVKTQANKAARIPRNELIDMLHSAFDQYAYWPMKALKQRTRQPEAYLKEVLQDLANLVKTGPYASCWRRMDMYSKDKDGITEGAPPSDDDEDEDMVDVV